MGIIFAQQLIAHEVIGPPKNLEMTFAQQLIVHEVIESYINQNTKFFKNRKMKSFGKYISLQYTLLLKVIGKFIYLNKFSHL